MAQSRFKVGEVVQLKSGGPRMTVTAVPESGEEGGVVQCSWFAHGQQSEKINVEDFPPESLDRTGKSND
jgi:uncharacterized protein YodC (DUF2158 family)